MATKMKFYDVKFKQYIFVGLHSVWKVQIKTKRGVRYAFKAKTPEGRKLTRFASKRDWDIAGCPEM